MRQVGLWTALLAGTVASAAFAASAPDPRAAPGVTIMRDPGLAQVAGARHRTRMPAPIIRNHARVPIVPILPGNPNLTLSPSLRQPSTGAETYSDRVLRCTHYGGTVGATPGQMGSFVHSCAMQ